MTPKSGGSTTYERQAAIEDVPGSLTHWQVWFFRHTGYLAVPQLFSQGEVEELRVRLEGEMARESGIQADDGGRVVKISELVQAGSELVSAFHSAAMVEALESLLGPNIELLLNRHNHATRGVGAQRARRLHRDVLQWSRTIVSAIVYLDDSTDGRAATRVVPASHLLPFVGRPNNGGTWMDEHEVFGSLMEQAVPVPLGAGGVLLMDGVLFHGAGSASEEGDRLCATLAYRASDELDRSGDGVGSRIVIAGEPAYKGHAV